MKLSQENFEKILKEGGHEILSDYKGTQYKVIVKCVCGNKIRIRADTLLYHKNIKQCICNKNKLKEEYVKEEFFKKGLILLSKYINVNSKVKIKCFCENIFYSLPLSILYNHTTSCGCAMYQYNKGKNSYKWKGEGDISAHLWHRYKSNANTRNMLFGITIEDAWNKFLEQNKQCTFTGIKLIFGKSYKDRSLTTASLDRINPNKGYIIDNIQWVHKKINDIKWDLSKEDFLYWVYLINNPKPMNEDFVYIEKKRSKNYKGEGNLSGDYWGQIKRGASKRNISFEITIKEAWNKFLEQSGQCAITGINIYFSRKYKKEYTASLDRINPNKGYTINNIQWVHKNINCKLKKYLSIQELYYWTKLVEKYNENKEN